VIKKVIAMETKEVSQIQKEETKGKTMTDQELLELNLSSKQIAFLLSQSPEIQELNKLTSFYEYEKEYVRIVKDIGRQALELHLGDVGKDRRKKKLF